MNIPFRSLGLVYRFWEQVFRWRWRLLTLVASFAFAYEFHIWRIRKENYLGGVDLPLLIFLAILIFPALGIISLGLQETRVKKSRAVNLSQLKRELSRQLSTTKEWDDVASILFRFIASYLPINGLSLIVYNQTSKKFETVAKKFSVNETELSGLSLPLIHGGKQRALLNLHMVPDGIYPTAQTEMIQSLTPEIALTIERIDILYSLTENIQAIQKKEQDRIAKHLHETLGPDLAYLCLKLDQLSNPGYMDGSVTIHSEIETMHSVANNAYNQVRSLLSELRDEHQALSSTDLVSDVKECALLIGARANFQVNLKTDGNRKILPPQIQRQILYLVREAIRNIERHAHAQNVNLTLNWGDDGLTIKISDDGQGFDVSRKLNNDGHYGIRIIQEIVDELNGSLSVESGQNEGTQITLWLPLN
jgi:signal transduction histidine kinase